MPVTVGQSVTVGECVMILESMKMEVRVEAPVAGIVSEILVKDGAQVKSGMVMLVIDDEGEDQATESHSVSIPWESERDPVQAGQRARSAVLGWDFDPAELKRDIELLTAETCEHILVAFADVAELFERRPTRQKDGGTGATDAISPDIWMETLYQRGPSGLSEERRKVLTSALEHFGVTDLESSPSVMTL